MKNLWNNKEIEVVKIDGRWFALYGWNGEMYSHCWEVDENTFALKNEQEYEIIPVYKENADGDFEIIDYKIL